MPLKISLLFLTVESCIIVYAANKTLIKRFHSVLIYSFFIGTQIIRRLIILDDSLSFVIYVSFHILSLLVCYRKDIKKKITILCIIYALSVSCEITISIIISLFFGENYYENTTVSYIAGTLHKLLLFVAVFLFLKISKTKFHIKDWLKYLPIPIGVLAALIWFYATNYDNREVFGQILAIGILGFLTCIFMIGYIKYKEEQKQISERLRMVEEHEWHRRHYEEDKDTLIRYNNRLSHDSHHHIEYITSLSNIEDVHEYAARILKLNKHSMQLTGNQDIDSILWPKQQRAHEKEIEFKVVGLLPKYIDFIDPIDIVTIIGNGLANAIDACEQIEATNRFINVSFRLDNHLDIRIDNPYAIEPVVKKDGWFSSTKKDPCHGIGMESIQEAVERYQGHMETVIGDGVFSLRIMLQRIESRHISMSGSL